MDHRRSERRGRGPDHGSDARAMPAGHRQGRPRAPDRRVDRRLDDRPRQGQVGGRCARPRLVGRVARRRDEPCGRPPRAGRLIGLAASA